MSWFRERTVCHTLKNVQQHCSFLNSFQEAACSISSKDMARNENRQDLVKMEHIWLQWDSQGLFPTKTSGIWKCITGLYSSSITVMEPVNCGLAGDLELQCLIKGWIIKKLLSLAYQLSVVNYWAKIIKAVLWGLMLYIKIELILIIKCPHFKVRRQVLANHLSTSLENPTGAHKSADSRTCPAHSLLLCLFVQCIFCLLLWFTLGPVVEKNRVEIFKWLNSKADRVVC